MMFVPYLKKLQLLLKALLLRTDQTQKTFQNVMDYQETQPHTNLLKAIVRF